MLRANIILCRYSAQRLLHASALSHMWPQGASSMTGCDTNDDTHTHTHVLRVCALPDRKAYGDTLGNPVAHSEATRRWQVRTECGHRRKRAKADGDPVGNICTSSTTTNRNARGAHHS